MTNKELSAAIRAELKKAGYTSKDYSIRVRDAGYETSVRITIKNPAVYRKDIERIANKYKAVEYDARTMEVLAGCNTFVHVDYEWGLFDEVSKPYEAQAAEIIKNTDSEITRVCEGLAIYKGTWFELHQRTLSENGVFANMRFSDIPSLARLLYKFDKFKDIAA